MLQIRFDGAVDDDAFRAYLAAYDDILARGQRYAIILDASTAGVPSSTQRRLQVDFMRDRSAVIRALCVGGAFVILSPLIRGALTAILWAQSMPFDHVVVGTRAEGEAWCRRRLEAAGVDGTSDQ